jgi:cytochrome c biogenesis protein CcdA
MIGVLLLGLLVGMKHALEADHVAAVATLATRSATVAERVQLASMWGAGHAGTLFVFGGTVLALGLSLPEHLTRVFEGVVGVMLIALGLDVLRRREHFRAHARAASRGHEHTHGVLPRALLVGSVHGLAGTAALVVLSLQLTQSTMQALLYLATFGLGSVTGMAALSLAISLPVRLTSARLGSGWRMVEGALGVVTIGLGCWMAWR